jgi:hypothetical protein
MNECLLEQYFELRNKQPNASKIPVSNDQAMHFSSCNTVPRCAVVKGTVVTLDQMKGTLSLSAQPVRLTVKCKT